MSTSKFAKQISEKLKVLRPRTEEYNNQNHWYSDKGPRSIITKTTGTQAKDRRALLPRPLVLRQRTEEYPSLKQLVLILRKWSNHIIQTPGTRIKDKWVSEPRPLVLILRTNEYPNQNPWYSGKGQMSIRTKTPGTQVKDQWVSEPKPLVLKWGKWIKWIFGF